MRNNFIYIIFFVFSFTNHNLLAQSDSSNTIDPNKLEFSPAFHSVQIDGNVFIISYEFGGHLDFDLFQSQNNVCLGTRLSVEHYTTGDFGGTTSGSPFTNYNFYLRFSKILDNLSFNFLGGISYYQSSTPDYYPSKGLPRIGFEIKYGKIVGVIIKGATSFKDRTGFFGVGVSLEFCHL